MTYEVQRTIIRNDGKKQVAKLMFTGSFFSTAMEWKKQHINKLKAMQGFKEYISINEWTSVLLFNKGQVIITIEKWNA